MTHKPATFRDALVGLRALQKMVTQFIDESSDTALTDAELSDLRECLLTCVSITDKATQSLERLREDGYLEGPDRHSIFGMHFENRIDTLLETVNSFKGLGTQLKQRAAAFTERVSGLDLTQVGEDVIAEVGSEWERIKRMAKLHLNIGGRSAPLSGTGATPPQGIIKGTETGRFSGTVENQSNTIEPASGRAVSEGM